MKRFRTDPFPTATPTGYPTPAMKELFQAIIALKNETEAKNFFRDLLTIPEIKEFSNRWQMVKMIRHGSPYATIAKKLHVSTATVTRVAHWLNKGFGGYKALANRLFPS